MQNPQDELSSVSAP